MKCSSCGRGITWQRVSRDAALFVVPDDDDARAYCGLCCAGDELELDPADFHLVLLHSSILHPRFCSDGGWLREFALELS